MSNTVWTAGAYWAMAMPDQTFGFCRLMAFPYAAFLKRQAHVAEADVEVLDASRVLFVIAVHRTSLRRWTPTAARSRLPMTDELPPVFMQNEGDLSQCSIRGLSGEMRPARPDECTGLERAAVWSAAQAETRLWDSLNGRPNAHAESLRVKLPV